MDRNVRKLPFMAVLSFLILPFCAQAQANEKSKNIAKYKELMQSIAIDDYAITDSRNIIGAGFVQIILEEMVRNRKTGCEEEQTDSLYCELVDVVTTPKEIRSTYDRNEVAGDLKFLKKKILISGKIVKISSTVMNEPALSFQDGGNEFMPTQAYFYRPDLERIAELRKGQDISLLCEGGGEYLSAPVLRKCQFIDSVAERFWTDVIRNGHATRALTKGKKWSGPQALFATVRLFDGSIGSELNCSENKKICLQRLDKLTSDEDHWEYAYHPYMKKIREEYQF